MSAPRRRIVAGNWKMHKTLEGALELAGEVARATEACDVDVVVLPPTCLVHAVASALDGSHVGVGAQNLHPEPQGAYTGEVSGAMLASVGCRWVVCGHSERRQLFGETSAFVAAKVGAALRFGLRPILCVGETLEERESDRTEAVIDAQLKAVFGVLSADEMAETVVAYEPVWAIGTGRTATPEQAQQVHAHIRELIRARFGAATADRVRIQYGGSVKPNNAATLLGQPDIDGALVGGASLTADAFAAIVRA